MTVQFGTAFSASSADAATTRQVSLPAPATPGRLVVAGVSVDKAAGDFGAVPTGFTSLFTYSGVSVGGTAAFRVATGTSADSPTFAWTNLHQSSAAIVEYAIPNPTLEKVAVSPLADTNATSLTVDPGPASAAGIAVAFTGVDSAPSWTTGNPTFSGGYSASVINTQGNDVGRTTIAVAFKLVQAGDPTAVTATYGGSDQNYLAVAVFAAGAGSPPPPPPASASAWVGAVSPTGATVQVHTSETNQSVTLRRSTSAGLASPTSTTVSADALGNVRFPLTGLAADTAYFYDVQIGGQTLAAGDFQTFPAAAASFSFAFGSCRLSNTNPPVFTAIADRNPRLFLEIGDFHYNDITTNDPALYRAGYDDITSQSHIRGLLSTVPTSYVWDDHDYGANDSDKGNPGRLAAQQVYRERVPHYPLPASDGGIHHTFTYGRARFIVLDLRSYKDWKADPDTAGKSMLGATQKTWLKGLLAAETLPLTFLVSSVAWNAAAEASADHWGMFATERAEIAAAIEASSTNVVVLAGDMHQLAADDGSSANGEGLPVLHASPFNQSGTVKGGPYSAGTYAGNGLYGWVTVTDTPGLLTVDYAGTDTAGTVRITASVPISFEEAQPAPVTHVTLIDRNGQEWEIRTPGALTDAVFRDGMRPKTGSVGDNMQALRMGYVLVPALNDPVLKRDIDTDAEREELLPARLSEEALLARFAGAADGVIAVDNAAQVPTANPTGGGVLYAEGGALKWRGPSGTVTTIASA